MCVGTIGDSHEAAEAWQVGLAFVGRQADARAALDDIARITVVGDVEDLQLLQRVAHGETGTGVLFNAKAFSLGIVAEGEVARLRGECHGREQQDGNGKGA